MGPADIPLPHPEGLDDVVDVQWWALAAPGPTLTGAERVGVARTARRVRAARCAGGPVPDADDPLGRLATVAAAAPAALATGAEARLADLGLDVHRYLEVVSVVARTTAVDTALRGLGEPLRPLPDPDPGPPTGEVDAAAAPHGTLVPTVGPPDPTTVLTALPSEARLQEDLHDALLLTWVGTGDLEVVRDTLHRTQLELVAARAADALGCPWCVVGHAAALRASAERCDLPADPAAAVDPAADPGLPGGRQLLDLASDLLVAPDHLDAALALSRARLVDRLGPAAAARAACVTGNQEMVARLVLAASLPLTEAMRAEAATLGLGPAG